MMAVDRKKTLFFSDALDDIIFFIQKKLIFFLTLFTEWKNNFEV